METYNEPSYPAHDLGLSPERVSTIGVVEAKSLIRESKVYKKYKLSGVHLTLMNANEVRVWLATGVVPSRLTDARPVTVENNNENDAASKAIKALQSALGVNGSFDRKVEEAINSIDSRIDKLLSERVPVVHKIEVKTPERTYEIKGRQHYKFEIVLKLLQCPSINIALVGPAGSGKSRLALEAARALNLDYSPVSFNILSSKSDVLGFTDAHGSYHPSAFRNRFENGGLFVADEFDACHAGIATLLNAAVANHSCTFGDQVTVEAHKDFRFCCCMNTWGTGATAEYVGRNRLDAATLDRFAFVQVDYDDSLESSLAGVSAEPKPFNLTWGDIPSPADWLSMVNKARETAKRENIRAIISPRATIMGIEAASVGIGAQHLSDMFITKGLSAQDKTKLEMAIGVH